MQLHYIVLWVAGVWHCGRSFNFGDRQFSFCIWLYCSLCVWLKAVAYPFQGSISSSLRMVIMASTSQNCAIETAGVCKAPVRSSPAEPGRFSWNTKAFIQLNLFSLENLGYRKHFVFLFTLFSLGNSANVQTKFSWSLVTAWVPVWGKCCRAWWGTRGARKGILSEGGGCHVGMAVIATWDTLCQIMCKIFGF